jgi:hypothetical protein
MTEDLLLKLVDNSITGLLAILLVWKIERRLTELISEIKAIREVLIFNNYELKKVKEWVSDLRKKI